MKEQDLVSDPFTMLPYLIVLRGFKYQSCAVSKFRVKQGLKGIRGMEGF